MHAQLCHGYNREVRSTGDPLSAGHPCAALGSDCEEEDEDEVSSASRDAELVLLPEGPMLLSTAGMQQRQQQQQAAPQRQGSLRAPLELPTAAAGHGEVQRGAAEAAAERISGEPAGAASQQRNSSGSGVGDSRERQRAEALRDATNRELAIHANRCAGRLRLAVAVFGSSGCFPHRKLNALQPDALHLWTANESFLLLLPTEQIIHGCGPLQGPTSAQAAPVAPRPGERLHRGHRSGGRPGRPPGRPRRGRQPPGPLPPDTHQAPTRLPARSAAAPTQHATAAGLCRRSPGAHRHLR